MAPSWSARGGMGPALLGRRESREFGPLIEWERRSELGPLVKLETRHGIGLLLELQRRLVLGPLLVLEGDIASFWSWS